MTFIAIILIVSIISIIVTGVILAKTNTNKEPVLCQTSILKGTVRSIKEDKSGLSRVIVEDNRGRLVYGFSTLSVDDLTSRYGGKGKVQILLTTPPAGRAYPV